MESAIHVLDDGMKAFPRTANLLLSKGYRYQELGDKDLAATNFRAAEALAHKNLTESPLSEQDQATLKAAAEALKQQSDSAVMERRFEQKVLILIAAGDCTRAITELHSARLEWKVDAWFDLLYISNHNCFAKTGDAKYREAAKTALTDGLRAFPSSPRLLLQFAAFQEEEHDIAAAIKLYQAALDSPGFDATFVGARATIQRRIDSLR